MPVTESDVRRVRMSIEEFWALPEDSRAEWVDGEVVMSPRSAPRHGVAVAALIGAFLRDLPHTVVTTETLVSLLRQRFRAPDVSVLPPGAGLDGRYVEVAPVLVVEVLSPSTRTEDTIRKSAEYAAAGIGQYWVVDPELRTIDVLGLVEGAWEPLLHLDDDHPAGDVAVAEHGTVAVDLDVVLPR